MAKNLSLDWIDLKNISNLNYSEDDNFGVYLWGFTINNNFVPYYIGIAKYINYRILEHARSITSGMYTIFHKDSLENFKQFKNDKADTNNDVGKLYEPNWPKDYKNFVENLNLLQTHINFMVEKFTYSYAILDKNHVSLSDLKEIEKTCINQIGIENLINTRAGKSDKYNLIHRGNSVVCEILKKIKTQF